MCICVHAEQNAILQAARLGYSLEGAHCYTTLRPCFGCLKELRQAGAERVVYLNAWEPPAEPEREAYNALLGRLEALGTTVEHLDLDPAVLQLGQEAPPPSRARAVRRPPPIAALFTLLAAGLALIAVAAWDGGAPIPAVAAAVLAAWMAGIALRTLRS